eukprot:6137636-Pleurochrysis_carterae.AAC.1
MPVRKNDGGQVEVIWEKVMEDVAYRGSREFIMNGDFNAETDSWIKKNGRKQMEEDVMFQGILEDLNLITCITEDYTFERARTQIDNILVPIELLHTLQTAYTTTGVREKDHKLVVASLAWEVQGDKGVARPIRRYADKFEEEHWCRYEQILEERIMDLKELLKNLRPSEKLKVIQETVTKAAAEAIGEKVGHGTGVGEREDGYNRREEKELNKEEQKRERLRQQLFMWNRHLYHAQRYTGGKGNAGGFWRRRDIKQDYILNKVAGDNRRARRLRVIEICEEQRTKAEEQLKGIRREINKNNNADALIQSLRRLGKGARNMVIRVFDIIKKAGGNGVNVQRGIAGVYQEDDKNRPIIRGPGIRGEVHKIASKINKADSQDIETVRGVLKWLGLGSSGQTCEDRIEEINKICAKENGKRAMGKFQQHKGLGSDGFDGYLIKNAPQEIQEIYHQVITDILAMEDYPSEWNEWIAVLMMKPGEDPFELGRRRDIWLQCHSMKYVCRLLESEYNKVAEQRVPITQAGWTEERMATEHSLTVRIIEERCELHRKPCIKGYVDMGCFFMSVQHEVQWVIEEAMGVPETIISILKALREGKGKGLHGLTGRYETAYGITEPVEIQKGLGQGDLLSPVRSKLILAVIQAVMQRLVPGIEFNVKGSRSAPFLIYADDGIILTDSIHTLQLAMEVMWVMTKILGLHMQIKGKKKTAWSGIYYNEEGKENDITGWEVRLPDGEKIPQLMGAETYKYIGTHLRPGRARGGSIRDMRKIVAGKAKRIIFAIGRLPGLSQEQLGKTLALGIAGVLGYYARSTPMDMGTCKSIEEARVKVLRAAGYATGWPRGQIYHRAQGTMWPTRKDGPSTCGGGPSRNLLQAGMQRNTTARMEPDTPARGTG